MKILVTGGAGFIGSFIVDKLVDIGHEVTIYDNLDPQVHTGGREPHYLNPGARFVRGDMRDYDALKEVVTSSEVIFHKAAAVGVGQSQYEIRHYVEANTLGTANLLDILVNQKNSVRKLVVAASMSSYGEGMYRCDKCGEFQASLRPSAQTAQGLWEVRCPTCDCETVPVPTPENAHLNSNSIYAFTKKDQEDMALNIGLAYDIPVVALRYFNVFGPRQSLSNPYTGVLAIFMSRLKNEKPPVIYEDGLQSRDFISIHDIVEANILAMEHKEADYKVFNVGSGKPSSILSIARTLAKMLGKTIEPEVTNQYRKGDIRHCYADTTRISKVLGFQPKVSLTEAIEELIEWSGSVEAIDRFEKAYGELKSRGLA